MIWERGLNAEVWWKCEFFLSLKIPYEYLWENNLYISAWWGDGAWRWEQRVTQLCTGKGSWGHLQVDGWWACLVLVRPCPWWQVHADCAPPLPWSPCWAWLPTWRAPLPLSLSKVVSEGLWDPADWISSHHLSLWEAPLFESLNYEAPWIQRHNPISDLLKLENLVFFVPREAFLSQRFSEVQSLKAVSFCLHGEGLWNI